MLVIRKVKKPVDRLVKNVKPLSNCLSDFASVKLLLSDLVDFFVEPIRAAVFETGLDSKGEFVGIGFFCQCSVPFAAAMFSDTWG